MSKLQNNITSLQSLLEAVNNLPEAGIDLPELNNEGIADDLVIGKELINSSGDIVIGTNPYKKVATDTEVATQADLIAQIKSTVDNLPEAGGGGSASYDTCTVNITAPNKIDKIAYLTVNADGELEPIIMTTTTTSYSFTCICNSFVTIGVFADWSYNLTNADYLGWIYSPSCRTFVITASSGETATITFMQQTGGAE